MLLVTTPSNEKYIAAVEKVFNIQSVFVFRSDRRKFLPLYNEEIIAMGGGAILDMAKIMAGKKPIIAIPTTASGAACTNWAVVWGDKTKKSVKTPKPILCELYKHLDIKLSKKVKENTCWDCCGHVRDSLHNKKRTTESLGYCDLAVELLLRYEKEDNIAYLIDAGNMAGRAINITGTSYYHALSYVLTLDYGIPHGEAVKHAIKKTKKFDWKKIDRKARRYKKYFNYEKI